MNNLRYDMPVGEYAIFDPCLVLDEAEYEKLKASFDSGEKYLINDTPVAVYRSTHGDNEYQSNINLNQTQSGESRLRMPVFQMFTVEDELLACIPVSECNQEMLADALEKGYGIVSHSKYELNCYTSGSIICFGSIRIDTESDYQPHEEDCEDFD